MTAPVALKQFRWPGLVVAGFLTRRGLRMSIIWGVVFGILTLSTAFTFANAYPTTAGREQIASSFGGNAGLRLLVGEPRQIATVAGFTEWRVLGLAMLVGSIWGFLTATKIFRGNEDAGRWEILLSGQTTARRATLNGLAALLASVTVAFVLTAILAAVGGQAHSVQIPLHACVLFAVVIVLGAALFMAIGALTSQIMPVRQRAAAMAAGVFGLSFVLRGLGDAVSGLHWLTYVSPLGWIEHIRPLTGLQVQWFLPVLGLIFVCSGLAVYIANRRDLGASVLADKDTARAKTRLLNTPFGLGVRLTRPVILAWAAGICMFSLIIGSVAKSATQAFSSSNAIRSALTRTTEAQSLGPKLFLGVAFFMLMTLLMVFVANHLNAVREDEAEGYLDNLLVRPVSRVRWLLGRLLIVIGAVVCIALLATSVLWLSSHLQHTAISARELLEAGLNAIAPAALLLGISVLIFGWLPRLTAPVSYGIIAWSFLVQMLGSFGNLNHWILDTSILHHLSLAPATAVRWDATAWMFGAGLIAATAGTLHFRTRDLANE